MCRLLRSLAPGSEFNSWDLRLPALLRYSVSSTFDDFFVCGKLLFAVVLVLVWNAGHCNAGQQKIMKDTSFKGLKSEYGSFFPMPTAQTVLYFDIFYTILWYLYSCNAITNISCTFTLLMLLHFVIIVIICVTPKILQIDESNSKP